MIHRLDLYKSKIARLENGDLDNYENPLMYWTFAQKFIWLDQEYFASTRSIERGRYRDSWGMMPELVDVMSNFFYWERYDDNH